MVYEAKEGSNLCVGLWWCALSDGFIFVLLGQTPHLDTQWAR